MKTRSQPSRSFEQWVAQATAGLPEAVASEVVEELADHYQATVDELLAAGTAPQQASRHALSRLGSASLAADGLKDVYCGHRHYQVATLVAIATLIFYFTFPAIYAAVGGPAGMSEKLAMALYVSLLAAPTLYVLTTLRKLFVWRFQLRDLDGYLKLAWVAFAMTVASDVIGLLAYGYSLNIGLGQPPTLSQAQWPAQFVVLVTTMVGYALLGFALSIIGWRLARWHGRLYGLRRLLAVDMFLMGPAMMTVPLWLAADVSLIQSMAFVLATAGQLFMWPLLILLFFRATFRPPPALIA